AGLLHTDERSARRRHRPGTGFRAADPAGHAKTGPCELPSQGWARGQAGSGLETYRAHTRDSRWIARSSCRHFAPAIPNASRRWMFPNYATVRCVGTGETGGPTRPTLSLRPANACWVRNRTTDCVADNTRADTARAANRGGRRVRALALRDAKPKSRTTHGKRLRARYTS